MASYLFDSNILIYSTSPNSAYHALRDLLVLPNGAVSAMSQVEVLGFSRLAAQDQFYLEATFAALEILPVTNQIIALAISVANRHGLKAADAIIAASALATQRTSVTADQHFKNITGLALLVPPMP